MKHLFKQWEDQIVGDRLRQHTSLTYDLLQLSAVYSPCYGYTRDVPLPCTFHDRWLQEGTHLDWDNWWGWGHADHSAYKITST